MTSMFRIIALLISLTAISDVSTAATDDSSDVDTADTSDTCYTTECEYTAAYILNNMNSEIDPCDDFFTFACGGYVESTTIPSNAKFASIFTEMRSKITTQLGTSLAESSTDDISTISLAKDLYATCRDTGNIEGVGLQPLTEIVTELGSWPVLQGDDWSEDNFDWTQSVQTCRELGCGYDWFVTVDVIIDPVNITMHVIDVEQPTFGLSTEYLIQGLKNENVQAYLDYMVDIAVILGANHSIAVEQLTESLEFEIALAEIVTSSETLEHNLITVADLQELSSNIEWVDYLNNLLASDVSIDETEPALVNTPNYISGLDNLLANTPKRVLANYYVWRVIESLSEYSIAALREREDVFDEAVTGETNTERRQETCLSMVREQLPISIAALYVRQYVEDGTKEAVDQVFAAMKTKIIEVIEETEWMDDESRTFALEKADDLNGYIAYPEELLDDATLDEFHANLQIDTEDYLQSILNVNRFWKNYSFSKLGTPVNESDWVVNTEATVVNAYYNTDQNSVHLPAGILQDQMFGLDRPAYVNYATIGAFASNEMTHSFDDWGNQYDKDGFLLPTSWWSTETKQKYQENADCIIEQYNGYTVESLDLAVNGSRTVQQNMADNSGVTVAYLAYQKYVETYGSELKLPGLDYTQEQLFWISTANNWCSKYESDALKTYVETDSHSPAQFRVIGPLSNRPEFAEAFSCSVGSTMNPEQKCSVW